MKYPLLLAITILAVSEKSTAQEPVQPEPVQAVQVQQTQSVQVVGPQISEGITVKPKFGEVKEVDTANKRAVIQVFEQTEGLEGSSVRIVDGESSCTVKVSEVNDPYVQVDYSSCSNSVKVGLLVEKSLFDKFAQPVVAVKEESVKTETESVMKIAETKEHMFKPRVSIGLNYSFATNFRFEKGYLSARQGTTYNYIDVNGRLDVQRAIGISLSSMVARYKKWGLSVGINLEEMREVDGLTLSSTNATVYGAMTGAKPKIGTTVVEVNSMHHLGKGYWFAGLNASVPRVEGMSSANEYVEVTGSVGLQVGGGLYINEMTSLELAYRIVGVRAKWTINDIPNTSYYMLDSGYMSSEGAVMQLKFSF